MGNSRSKASPRGNCGRSEGCAGIPTAPALSRLQVNRLSVARWPRSGRAGGPIGRVRAQVPTLVLLQSPYSTLSYHRSSLTGLLTNQTCNGRAHTGGRCSVSRALHRLSSQASVGGLGMYPPQRRRTDCILLGPAKRLLRLSLAVCVGGRCTRAPSGGVCSHSGCLQVWKRSCRHPAPTPTPGLTRRALACQPPRSAVRFAVLPYSRRARL